MERTKPYLWKKCSFCGVVTDEDADECPQTYLNNGKHELKEILLTVEHFIKFLEEGKVIARHHNHPQIKAAMGVKKIR